MCRCVHIPVQCTYVGTLCACLWPTHVSSLLPFRSSMFKALSGCDGLRKLQTSLKHLCADAEQGEAETVLGLQVKPRNSRPRFLSMKCFCTGLWRRFSTDPLTRACDVAQRIIDSRRPQLTVGWKCKVRRAQGDLVPVWDASWFTEGLSVSCHDGMSGSPPGPSS